MSDLCTEKCRDLKQSSKQNALCESDDVTQNNWSGHYFQEYDSETVSREGKGKRRRIRGG